MPALAPAAPTKRSSALLLVAVAVVAAVVIAAVVLAPRQETTEPALVEVGATTPAVDAVPPVVTAPETSPPTPPAEPPKATAVPPTPPKGGTPPAAPTAAVPAGTRPPAAKAVPPVTPAPATDPAREATTRLEVARAKLSNNLVDQGLADLRAIVTDYPATAVAADASFLTAQTLTSLGRADDAMAAHVEFANRFAGDARLAESQLALAELTLKSRQPNRDEAARVIFGRAATAAPGTPTALRALQAKAGIEERRRLRERDPAIGREVPAQLATLRMLADQFPDSPHGMLALYRLGTAWSDLDQWDAGRRRLHRPGDALSVESARRVVAARRALRAPAA